jgi:hypothetical protein
MSGTIAMKQLIFRTTILLLFSTSFGNNLIGIDYGYMPSLLFHYNYYQSSLSGDSLIDYNKTYYDFSNIGLFYNYSVSNRFVLSISSECFYKNIYNSKFKDTFNSATDTFYNSATISNGENRISIDFGVLYKFINNSLIQITVGPSLGYTLLWQSNFINFTLNKPPTDNSYKFSFYGSSPYIKMSCYSYFNIFNPFGLRIGVDYIYSEIIFKNPNKTITVPSGWIFVNGASKCYENQFVYRIGLFYNI